MHHECRYAHRDLIQTAQQTGPTDVEIIRARNAEARRQAGYPSDRDLSLVVIILAAMMTVLLFGEPILSLLGVLK